MANGSADEWEQNWRKGVDGKLDQLTNMVQGLVNRMTVNEGAIQDLRRGPGEVREWSSVVLIGAGICLSMLCGGSSLVVSVVSVIWSHWPAH